MIYLCTIEIEMRCPIALNFRRRRRYFGFGKFWYKEVGFYIENFHVESETTVFALELLDVVIKAPKLLN